MGGEDTQPVADTIATLLSAHCMLFVVFFFLNYSSCDLQCPCYKQISIN